MTEDQDEPAPVVVVTGAARGIGLATGKRALAAGAKVVFVDMHDSVVHEVKELQSDRAVALQFDLTEADSPQGIVSGGVDAFGRIDALVNNAAMGYVKPFVDIGPEELDRVLGLNFRALFRLTQAVTRQMIDQGDGGAIVNVASISALLGFTGQTAYAASKGAVASFTRALAVELAPFGIRCNSMAPGPTQTGMLDSAIDSREIRAREHRIALARLGKPHEQAETAWFLASRASSYITGQLVPVDGGYSAMGMRGDEASRA